MTIFHVLEFVGWIGGAVIGFHYGHHLFGTYGGVLGCIVGLVIGHVAGKLPFLIAWSCLNIKNKSTADLRKILDGDQYYIYHLALASLMARGEDITCYKDKLLALLGGPDEDKRRFALGSLKLAFPELAMQVRDFNPGDRTEVCAAKVKAIIDANCTPTSICQPSDKLPTKSL